MVCESEGDDPNETNHPTLTTMTFTYSFKPQSMSEQKIDFDMTKESNPERFKQIEYARKLDNQQITERAMDDLTGASYVTDPTLGTMFVVSGTNAKKEKAEAAAAEVMKGTEEFMNSPAVSQEALDSFTGSSGSENGPKSGDDNPNPFDDTTGDPPGVPTNPKGGGGQQEGAGVNIFGSGGPKDPTTPEGGCEGDYDFWRPNPEECKFYSSMTSINLNEVAVGNEMDLLMNAMSVETMGM